MYKDENFTGRQAPWGGKKSAKNFELKHLVCKLWVCKVQRNVSSRDGGNFTTFCTKVSILKSELDQRKLRSISQRLIILWKSR